MKTEKHEDFDFAFNPKVPKAKVLELATCAYIDRSENVCLIGPAGVGKSHVAQALGTRAVRASKKTIYLSANWLFADLKAAKGDRSFDRVLARSIEEWAPLFGDPLLVSTAMDRLLHHSHTVTFEGRSYRTKDVSL